MSHKTYGISPAKIGNQDGFRLPRAFSRDYPQLVNASGQVEVLDSNTLLVRLNPPEGEPEEDEEESLLMGLFLDFLMKAAIAQPETLVPYSEEMSQELDDLLAEVEEE
jgi:antitoxin PrlF